MLWHLIKGLGRLLLIVFGFLIAVVIFILADHEIFGSWKKFKKDASDAAVWVWRGGEL